MHKLRAHPCTCNFVGLPNDHMGTKDIHSLSILSPLVSTIYFPQILNISIRATPLSLLLYAYLIVFFSFLLWSFFISLFSLSYFKSHIQKKLLIYSRTEGALVVHTSRQHNDDISILISKLNTHNEHILAPLRKHTENSWKTNPISSLLKKKLEKRVNKNLPNLAFSEKQMQRNIR